MRWQRFLNTYNVLYPSTFCSTRKYLKSSVELCELSGFGHGNAAIFLQGKQEFSLFKVHMYTRRIFFPLPTLLCGVEPVFSSLPTSLNCLFFQQLKHQQENCCRNGWIFASVGHVTRTNYQNFKIMWYLVNFLYSILFTMISMIS